MDMKATFTISQYVSICHCDENGTKGSMFMEEAQMSPKICLGKSLTIKTVEPFPKEIDLGVVEDGHHYTKRSCVDVKTEKGWFHIAFNESLYWLLNGNDGFVDLLDD